MAKEDKNIPDLEKMLTGEYLKGINEKVGVEPNAELERDEYIQFPDGTIQKVVGDKHEKGGVEVYIPDGTRILTNSIKLNKDQRKQLEEAFDIKPDTKDTFSKVMGEYTKKIGLDKLNKEQEDIFKEVRKQEESDVDPKTYAINSEYLSKKIYDIEDRKKELESAKNKMFDFLFAMQEETKKKDGTKDENFKYGGISRNNFNKVIEKYGLSEEEGVKLLSERNGYKYGGLKEYQNGDEKKSSLYNVKKREQDYTEGDTRGRVYQHSAKGERAGYGDVDDAHKALYNLWLQFPAQVEKHFGVPTEDKKFSKVDEENIKLSEVNEDVEALQEDINPLMVNQAKLVIDNKDSFDEDYRKLAGDYLTQQTFRRDASESEDVSIRARAFDGKLGNFTSTRYSYKLDLVTPEDYSKIQDNNIRTIGQLKTAIDNGEIDLSPESLERIDAYKDIAGDDWDKKGFGITEFTIDSPDEPSPKVEEDTDIDDTVDVPEDRDYPRLFYSPDQSALPPSGMDAHLRVSNRFGRARPVRVGVEDQMQAANESMNQVSDQLRDVPSNQRVAAITSALATTQANKAKTITEANRINAENLSKTELFNIGQADKESIYEGNNALNFEQRQLTAKAKTEEELRNYLDYNRKVALNTFKNNQRMNLMESLFPDYDLDFYGAGVNYNPEGEWETNKNNLSSTKTPQEIKRDAQKSQIVNSLFNIS